MVSRPYAYLYVFSPLTPTRSVCRRLRSNDFALSCEASEFCNPVVELVEIESHQVASETLGP